MCSEQVCVLHVFIIKIGVGAVSADVPGFKAHNALRKTACHTIFLDRYMCM